MRQEIENWPDTATTTLLYAKNKMGQLNSSHIMKKSHTWAKRELDNWLHLGKPLSIQTMFLLAQTNDC